MNNNVYIHLWSIKHIIEWLFLSSIKLRYPLGFLWQMFKILSKEISNEAKISKWLTINWMARKFKWMSLDLLQVHSVYLYVCVCVCERNDNQTQGNAERKSWLVSTHTSAKYSMRNESPSSPRSPPSAPLTPNNKIIWNNDGLISAEETNTKSFHSPYYLLLISAFI